MTATLRELAGALLAAAVVVAACLGLVLEAKDLLTANPVPMPEPAPHTRKLKLPMLINIAIDESSSMEYSDPNDRRWTDVEALRKWLARYQREDDLVVITRFTSAAVHGPIVSTRDLTARPRSLAPEPSGGGTSFLPVVDAAQEVFDRQPGAYYKILILLTDGDSPDAAAAIAKLPAVANQVFVVALDKGGAWDSARKGWENAGFPVTKLGNRATNEIGAAMATAVMKSTGQKEG